MHSVKPTPTLRWWVSSSACPLPLLQMYENFVEEVDAVDNGISQWEEGEPRYALTTTLSARVARLNPTWNQPNQDTEVGRA